MLLNTVPENSSLKVYVTDGAGVGITGDTVGTTVGGGVTIGGCVITGVGAGDGVINIVGFGVTTGVGARVTIGVGVGCGGLGFFL